MGTVILENKTRRPPRMLTFNLTKSAAPTTIETRSVEEGKDGQMGVRVVKKIVPGSLTVPVGVRREVDEKITKCPEVAAALKAKQLKIVARKSGNGNGGPKARRKGSKS